MFARLVAPVLLALACGWLACQPTTTPGQELSQETTGPADASTPDSAAPEPRPPKIVENPTYYGQIKTILQTKCNSCHVPGGLGPFPLDTYEKVVKLKAAVLDAVEQRRMPPWQADNSCREYSNDFSLTPQQRKYMLHWLKNGTPEGKKDEYVPPPPSQSGPAGLERVDLRLKMKEPYPPNSKRIDDYRCFVIDWPKTENEYVTGFVVKPGNARAVHHLIIYLADPKVAAEYVKAEKDAPGVGYPCFGGPGGDSYPSLLGAWAPGTPATQYPKGTGLLVQPGSKIILQIHYNLASKDFKPDQSTIELQTEKKVKQRAMIAPLVNPFWFRSRNMKIPKDQADVKHHFSIDMSGLIGKKIITVHGAALHMHLLGKTGQIYKTPSEDADKKQCMLHIPRWDFGWQSVFLFKQTVKLYPGDRMHIECRYDNSPQNQPIIDGQKVSSKDVYWGGKSRDEMCLGFLYITCTDLDGNPEDICFDF